MSSTTTFDAWPGYDAALEDADEWMLIEPSDSATSSVMIEALEAAAVMKLQAAVRARQARSLREGEATMVGTGLSTPGISHSPTRVVAWAAVIVGAAALLFFIAGPALLGSLEQQVAATTVPTFVLARLLHFLGPRGDAGEINLLLPAPLPAPPT